MSSVFTTIFLIMFLSVSSSQPMQDDVSPFMTLEEEQELAQQACARLGGESRIELSELFGEDHVYCSFEDGECTQGELNDGFCYKERQ